MDEGKNPVDILDEIMNRSEKPLPSPISYPPKFNPPAPEDSLPTPPPEKKPPLAERLMPWLGALLCGAVLALVLCGAQLFSVNAQLDGLQAAVDEIRTVDELMTENERLKTSIRSMVTDQQDMLARQEELEQEMSSLRNQDFIAEWSHQRAAALSWLERFCAQGEWLMAACVVEDCDAMFNPRNRAYGPAAPLPAVLSERYLQLREAVIEQSKLLAVLGYSDLEEQYFERVDIYPDAGPYEQKAVEAAMQLWPVLKAYGQGNSNWAAVWLEVFCDPGEQPYRAELEDGGAFQPDTVELFRQMLDDLSQLGLIQEHEDGTVATTGRTVDGSPAFVLD